MKTTTVFCDFCKLLKPGMTTIKIDGMIHDICKGCRADIKAKTNGTGEHEYVTVPYIQPYYVPYPIPTPRRRRWDDVWCQPQIQTWGTSSVFTPTRSHHVTVVNQKWC